VPPADRGDADHQAGVDAFDEMAAQRLGVSRTHRRRRLYWAIAREGTGVIQYFSADDLTLLPTSSATVACSTCGTSLAFASVG
jgi:hypothetical protein